MSGNQSSSSSFIPVPAEFQKNAVIKSIEEYQELYDRSINDPEGFWAEKARDIDWIKKWDKVLEWDFKEAQIKWFEGGQLNVSANCLDRHLLNGNKNKAALIWQGEADDESRIFTYQTLHREVCLVANVLKKNGVKKGDRVAIYMPMIPELAFAMLACSRIGAIHNIVFGGFSADALSGRIIDSGAKMVITADGSYRAGKVLDLKKNVDAALKICPDVETVIVVKRTENDVEMKAGRDVWYHDEMSADDISADCPPEVMDAEDPLFILYTSGSTGKPKGVMHTTAGYILFAQETFKTVFDVRPDDIYWCTADIGWVTGHSYIVYGPLAAGATSLMFEGVPTYPNPDRFWQIVEKYSVNIFYTAPTAIRAVAKEGDSWPNGRDLSSLRLLGTVGEPINPEAWLWYHQVIGKEKCPIVDTWWQTETGGILVTALPGAMGLKPGSATKPFFGVKTKIIREDGEECDVNETGYLIIEQPWPGIMRGVFQQPERFKDTYFAKFPGNYFTGDGARIDEDGYLTIIGRIDDVINVSGHRLGTAEIEDVLVSLEEVAEAAVVGYDHEVKGQSIYAFITPKKGIEVNDDLKKKAIMEVRTVIGPFASPEKIQFANDLPKTRSGKIMRRLLKKIASGDVDDMGDTSTLADPSVVDALISNRIK